MKWTVGETMPWHFAFGFWPDWYRECIKPGGCESSEREIGTAVEVFCMAVVSTPAIPFVPLVLLPIALLRWFIRRLRDRAKRKHGA